MLGPVAELLVLHPLETRTLANGALAVRLPCKVDRLLINSVGIAKLRSLLARSLF